MQGTVKAFDAETRSGSVLLDDGTELAFDAEAFAAGGLRLLRFGQRVNLALEGGPGGRVTAVTLSTFPLPT
ncbi:cold-shock protein [Actinomadura geliboluensis]|uniref:cold-shock protein n=1 Tax=Actinomadura geliboluensis TaxID=882440 RepID=UPI0036B4BE33